MSKAPPPDTVPTGLDFSLSIQGTRTWPTTGGVGVSAAFANTEYGRDGLGQGNNSTGWTAGPPGLHAQEADKSSHKKEWSGLGFSWNPKTACPQPLRVPEAFHLSSSIFSQKAEWKKRGNLAPGRPHGAPATSCPVTRMEKPSAGEPGFGMRQLMRVFFQLLR